MAILDVLLKVGTKPAAGSFSLTPYTRGISGNAVITKGAIAAKLVDGAAALEVPDDSGILAWRAREVVSGVDPVERWISVPTGKSNYADLPTIDPATLGPVAPEPEPAWWAALEAAIANGETGVGGGAAGPGFTAASVDESGHLHITKTDGTVLDLGKVTGTDGDDGAPGSSGVGITSATVDAQGHLVITKTDATTVDAGLVKGGKGDTGDTGPRGADGVGTLVLGVSDPVPVGLAAGTVIVRI